MNTLKIYGVYHKNCADGTTAAAVLLEKFPHIHLLPLEHGYSDEDLKELYEARGAQVYIVDFALNPRDLEALIAKGNKVVIIDHHVSAKESLLEFAEEHKELEYVFDNEKSGASLCWAYFFGDDSMPEVVKLAEDLDLWRFRYGDKTKYWSAYSYFLNNKPNETQKFFSGEHPMSEIFDTGEALSKFIEERAAGLAEHAEPLQLRIGKYKVNALNSPFFASEIGNAFYERHKEPVAIFSIKGGDVHFSFRGGENIEPTALELAKILGGGGHRNAAGARMKLQDFIKMIEINNS